MHIDWWTLALQTINVVILVWLLARFFFKPVTAIIAKRQEVASGMLADAENARQAAAKTRGEVEELREKIAGERDALITEATRAAKAEHDALLARANDELASLRAEAEAGIDRDRAAAGKALIARAGDLAVIIARRLVSRAPLAAGLDTFLDGLCSEIRELPPQMQAAFTSEGDGGDTLHLATATPIGADQRRRVQEAIETAFGTKLPISFDVDPSLIAGLELRCRRAIAGNSWKKDLEKIAGELKLDSELPQPTKKLARTSKVDR
jgi:F-type H+-transporting ATPase subunit b